MVQKVLAEERESGLHSIEGHAGFSRDVLDSLVLALMEHETLDKAEVAAIFEPLRRRPVRPAWTGSPTREPSRIPPVEVPKSAANGSGPEETQGAVILTPPGSGGDVHGDPTVNS